MDLPEDLKDSGKFELIPFTLLLNGKYITDDESFDQKAFIDEVKNSEDCPGSACPSPEMFKAAFEKCDEDNIFAVTISGPLSGCYNSALVAKKMYEEEHGKDKNIAVINSESASAGETNIALKICELCDMGLSFEEVEKRILEYRDHMKTYFVLETLDTLKKNGRLTGIQAFLATKLDIKPVMGSDKGIIIKLEQARGIQRALSRMADIIVRDVENLEDRRLVIAHCAAPDRAEKVREKLESLAIFKEIVVVCTGGLSTVYANDGGIIVSV